MSKRDIILDQIEYLSYEYVEIKGHRPSKELIEQWEARITKAYEEGIIT